MNGNTIYTDEELKQIQSAELCILKDVITVCDSLGIEYFVVGGTLLGAVRHNGFIPWDDDIDIGLTRDNYDKFVKYVAKELPEKYELLCATDKHYPYLYSKVRLKNTVFMEYCNHRNKKMNHGIYIDVFPFDKVPDDDKLHKKQFNKIQRLVRLFTLRESACLSAPPKTFLQKIKAFARYLAHILCLPIPRKMIVNKVYSEMTKYNGQDTAAVECLFSPVMNKAHIKFGELYPLGKRDFEGLKVNVPFDVDGCLKTQYGDYMRLPPPELRFGHKPYKIVL